MPKITVKEFFGLIKLLRIDVFFFMSMFSSLLPNIALNQLIQDKYCMNHYSANESVCLRLESSASEYDSIQIGVFKETTTLKMYITIITTIPTIFTSLIMGYWIDAYPNHLRYMLGFASAANVVQNIMVIYQCIHFETDPYSLLYTYLFPILTGSGAIIYTGTFTYATRKTPAKYRAIRFTVLEIFFFATMPTANTLGGHLIASDFWSFGLLRNYVGVYIFSSLGAVLATIWAFVMLNDSDQTVDQQTVEKLDVNLNNVEDGGKEKEEKVGFKQIVADLLKPDNLILSCVRCVFKKRPNNGHWYIISTLMAGFIQNMTYLGEQNIVYQFNQRVYHWDAKQIGYYGSLVMIFFTLGAIVGPPLFIYKMKLHDSAVAIIGIVSVTYCFLVKGLILSPIVYVFMFFGSFAGVLLAIDRSILSRMVPTDEVGKLFAFNSAIGGIIPILSSLYYTKVFQATIDYNPGLVYSLAAIMFIHPLGNAIVLTRNKEKWDLALIAEKQKDNKQESELTNPLLVDPNANKEIESSQKQQA
ncbi:uncharacterized protein LOC107364075 [Tetranychus urticae]|uniref:Major facilitator superfamily (MFS) profile domain-containing protein n=1 Tax=Tetranychus urticae TaxID=32264 RepID=T1KHY8_TETUR|nr:uncharacterized protein LOC107364075 [Tetranychus urticae]